MKNNQEIKTILSTAIRALSDDEFPLLKDELREILSTMDYEVDRETEKEENLRYAREQAVAQMSNISEMVAALNCDYDRLQELRDERESLQSDIANAETPEEVDAANGAMIEWVNENSTELEELETTAGDCENEDEARERINNDTLDISVRSDWQNIGETLTPSEFTILLCTGGPAVRIVGELDQHNEPCRAWLEYQDWFTPWTELVDGVSHSDLLSYCQQFYFGE